MVQQAVMWGDVSTPTSGKLIVFTNCIPAGTNAQILLTERELWEKESALTCEYTDDTGRRERINHWCPININVVKLN